MLCRASSLKPLCQGKWKILILKSIQTTVKKPTDFFLCFNLFTLCNIPAVPAFSPLLLALHRASSCKSHRTELTHKQEALFRQTGTIPLRSALHRLPGAPFMQPLGQLGLLQFKKKLLQFSPNPFQQDSKWPQLHHLGVLVTLVVCWLGCPLWPRSSQYLPAPQHHS